MAAPARVAARTAKTLAEIAAEVHEVKTGLLQIDGALAERLGRIEARLDQFLASPEPAKAETMAAHAEAATTANKKAK